MPEYRTPLPSLLAGFLEAGVNRVLALDPASEQRLLKLQDKTLQLDLEGLDITLFFSFDSGNVRVSLDSDSEPDTLIRGTPVALFSMAAPGDAESWGLPGSNVHISGDANLARALERLFSKLEPDFEKPITDLLGDVAGFQLASGLKQGVEAMRSAAESAMEMAGTFFRDESETLVRPRELDEFNRTVDSLNDAIGRLEARLKDMRGDDS
jgi:ubiquinone biosynthesis protein UbiJ